MIVDEDRITVNSQLIVSLANQALDNTTRLSITNWYKKMPSDHYRKEFGTVKISMPRRSGHTTAALQLLVEHPDSICFVSKHDQKLGMTRMLHDYTSDRKIINRVCNAIITVNDNSLKQIKVVKSRPFVIFDQTDMIREDVFEYLKEGYNAKIVVELQ